MSDILPADVLASSGIDPHDVLTDDVARLVVHENKVLGSHLVPGLSVDVEETASGIDAAITVKAGTVVARPVHMCFGVLPEEGLQEILLRINVQDGAKVSILAHCTFPNALKVVHRMNADIHVGKNAEYAYFERHVHGDRGGVTVLPKAAVRVDEGGRFRTEFELIKGRVGRMDIDYETTCLKEAVMEMIARISGSGGDVINISESGRLAGENSRGVLKSYIAVRGHAQAHVKNTLVAEAAYARGHVDCKEIVQDDAVATAVPIVEVRNPKAFVTHEAAIGSVDSRQLETLMSRGLNEEDATELIISGLLS
ncbi:MAG: SufD family Fe-S cluster assembly protein [Planctomycetes bacterium]|nr:SufD family Fe-S cluster assembly protein [Planctomycetota bacterium]